MLGRAVDRSHGKQIVMFDTSTAAFSRLQKYLSTHARAFAKDQLKLISGDAALTFPAFQTAWSQGQILQVPHDGVQTDAASAGL